MSGLDSIVDAEIVLSRDEWAARIRGHLGRAVEGIVAAGRDLIAAKADVRHGEWLPMLKEIGISSSDAHRYMRIGERFSDFPSLGNMPTSPTALMELSQLPTDELESGIESGDITPDMTIKDARNFARPEPEPTPEPEPAPRPEYPDGMPPGFNPGDLDELNTPAPEPDTTPEPATPKRRPLTDQANSAGWELRKAVERIERIAADDRFDTNKSKVAPHLRGHLTNAVEACQDLLDRINNN